MYWQKNCKVIKSLELLMKIVKRLLDCPPVWSQHSYSNNTATNVTMVSAIGFRSGSKVRSISSNRSLCESDRPLTVLAAATWTGTFGRMSSRFRRSFSLKIITNTHSQWYRHRPLVIFNLDSEIMPSIVQIIVMVKCIPFEKYSFLAILYKAQMICTENFWQQYFDRWQYPY